MQLLSEQCIVLSLDFRRRLSQTEKDKHHKLNGQTAGIYNPLSIGTTESENEYYHILHAGILAGVWSCGIIVLISELFVSESISQAYAIHEFLSRNKQATLLSLQLSYS